MALPSSGPISLSAIRTEFGGAAPDALSEYYAGGLHVPAGTSGVNGLVPSSGAISFSHFHGTSRLVLSVTLNDTSTYGGHINDPPSASPSTRLVTSAPDTVATAANGSGNYTFSWARISGSTDITAVASTAASTSFMGTIGFGQSTATFRVTVTDTSTGHTATADVFVTLTYHSGFW